MKIQSTNFCIKILFQTLFFLVSSLVSGQNSNLLKSKSYKDSGNTDKTSLIARQTDYLKKLYSENVEAPMELINGKEYEPYYLRSEVKPLLFPNRERTASILTRTRRYNNLTLQYDTYLDEVVYTDTSKQINFRFPQIALNKDIIAGFNLYFKDDSLIFRYFGVSDCSGKNLKEGFYEVVHEGKTSYIIKHESSFYQRQGLNNYKYSAKNLISTGGEFIRIKNKKSLLSLFGERSVEIKSFLHSAKIKMRKADKEQILAIVKFYDSLIKSN
jgi:hypothetical protein